MLSVAAFGNDTLDNEVLLTYMRIQSLPKMKRASLPKDRPSHARAVGGLPAEPF